jgi:NADPH:quinone reductase
LRIARPLRCKVRGGVVRRQHLVRSRGSGRRIVDPEREESVRAIVITRPGGPEVLALQARPTPEPGPGEVRVRVRASALNRADLLQRIGRYPAPPGAPADVPGLEYAGEVDAAGPGSTLWDAGDRVMGITGGGGHAEYVVVHEREAIAVPDPMAWEEAAAVPEAFLTAYDALFARLGLALGERLLVHAVGSGVGTAAVQLASAAGATVLGTSRSPDKLRRARALGLDVGIDSGAGDWTAAVRSAVGDAGVHAVLDLVGGRYVAQDLQVVAVGGRIAVVGTMDGGRAEIDLGLLLRRRVRLVGTVLRSRPLEEKIALARDFAGTVLPLFAAGRLRAVVDRVIPFTDIADAHHAMERDDTFGKIVLRWDA